VLDDTGPPGGQDSGEAPPPVDYCAGGAPAGGPFGYNADVRPILDLRCATCHTTSSNGGFSVPDGADGLVERPARGHADLPLVRAGAPESSYLWLKMTNTHRDVGGAGDWMPRGGQRLDAEECAVVEGWILGGAEP